MRFWIATGFGSGLLPVAPGTAGSAVALVIFWLLPSNFIPYAVFALFLVAGLWSAGPTARKLGDKDPGAIVIDEFAGQFLALLALPHKPVVMLAGFALFRLFDITKPPPARRLEKLPGAAGIMADDLIAGLYANLLLQIAIRLAPEAWGVV